MTDWSERLRKPLEAVRHGVDAADRQFATTHEGPMTFDRIDYPAAQVYLTEFARTGATDWQHTITVGLYFEWSRISNDAFVEEVIHPVSAVLDESLHALADVDCITDYHPNRINFFAGDAQGPLILGVIIDLQATTLLDPADFDN